MKKKRGKNGRNEKSGHRRGIVCPRGDIKKTSSFSAGLVTSQESRFKKENKQNENAVDRRNFTKRRKAISIFFDKMMKAVGMQPDFVKPKHGGICSPC